MNSAVGVSKPGTKRKIIATGTNTSSQSSLGLSHLRNGAGSVGLELGECDGPDEDAGMMTIYHT